MISVPDASLVTYTHIVYALHATSVLIGLTSAAFIVTAFIFGLPSIVAVVMNYARRSQAQGTYLESHFRWQIRTFWYALFGAAAIWIVSVPLIPLLGLGIVVLFFSLLLLGLWVVYRVAKGWLRLRDQRPMYA